MPGNGSQLQQIIEALLSAYPSNSDLTMMIRIQMGESLSAIAGGSNQRERVFHLVEWAVSTGNLSNLLDAAKRGNPNNPELKSLLQLPASVNEGITSSSDDYHYAPNLQRTTPFIGTIPYDSSSANLFFGRTHETDAIVRQLEQGRFLIINGRSGSGKTSLIRAGLIPRLKALGQRVIYASILDSPHVDVIRAIDSSLPFPPSVPFTDAVVALNQHHHKEQHSPINLIIDQVERCFTLTTVAEERNRLWRDIARIIGGEPKVDTRLILAIRADWLYAFQTANPLAETYPIFSFIRLIEPLSPSQAREALEEPLAYFDIQCDPAVIHEIIDDLGDSERRINPPQLQIVGQALYEHIQTKESEQGKHQLTLDDYSALDGTSTILSQHLLKVIKLMGPRQATCWHILLKLIDNDNRLSKAEDELRGNVAEQEFRPIMNILVNNAIVVRDTSASSNSPVYLLAHDYLVTEIQKHLGEDHRLQALRTGENYLTSGYQDWQRAREQRAQESDADTFIPMEKERYLYIWEYKEAFDSITEDSILFLTQSAMYHSHDSFGFWFAKLPQSQKANAVAYLASLLSQGGDASESKVRAIKSTIQTHLSSEDQGVLASRLFQTLGSKSTESRRQDRRQRGQNAGKDRYRQSVSRILWAVRRELAFPQMMQLLPHLIRYNAGKYGPATISMVIGALILGIVLAISWFIDDRLSGSWSELPLLHAGQITTISFDPASPTTLYVATIGGPKKGDRTTISKFSTTTKSAEIVGNNLAFEGISALQVQSEGGWQRFVAGIWGRGIYIKNGQQSEWKLSNRGISSYAVSSLVSSPFEPRQLFAGAANYGGVFRSDDSGESWQDISDETLFGVSVTTLASSSANGGAILAGSVDGRIFRLSLISEDKTWELVAAFPGEGEITALASEPVAGEFIYSGSSTGNIALSNDGGSTWIWMSRLPNVFRISSLAVKPGNPEVVFVNGYGVGGHNTWISRDYATTWQTVADNTFTREYLMLTTTMSDPDALYAYGSAGLFVSRNEGNSWQYQDGINAPVAAVGIIETSRLAGGATYAVVGGSIFTSAEQQRIRWIRGRSLPAVGIRTVVPDGTDHQTAYAGVYLPNRWSVYVTYDNGLNWEPTGVPSQIPERYLNDTMALALAENGNEHIIYAGTNGCGVIYSVDRGETWNTFERRDCILPDTAPTNVLKLAVDPHDINTVYAVADGSVVYASKDRGKHWQSQKLETVDIINGLAVDSSKSGRLYVITGVEGVWSSEDGGRTWQKLSYQFDGKYLVDIITSDRKDEIFVVSLGAEVWRSTDGGENWRNINRNLVANSATSLTYDPRTDELLLGTIGAGMYSFTSGKLFQ